MRCAANVGSVSRTVAAEASRRRQWPGATHVRGIASNRSTTDSPLSEPTSPCPSPPLSAHKAHVRHPAVPPPRNYPKSKLSGWPSSTSAPSNNSSTDTVSHRHPLPPHHPSAWPHRTARKPAVRRPRAPTTRTPPPDRRPYPPINTTTKYSPCRPRTRNCSTSYRGGSRRNDLQGVGALNPFH